MRSIGWQTLGTGDVLGHLRTDLKRATRIVWVVGPWIDAFFAQIVVASLAGSVELRVITRAPSGADAGFVDHAIAAHGYFDSRPNTVVKTLPNLHAKVAMIDNEVVYCGSTNRYRYSLQESREIVFRGPVARVSGLLDQMQIIWEQSKEAEQPISPPTKKRATTEGYMSEVIDPVAQAKLREVPGSFVIKTPRRRE